jgi:hypothetical protein
LRLNNKSSKWEEERAAPAPLFHLKDYKSFFAFNQKAISLHPLVRKVSLQEVENRRKLKSRQHSSVGRAADL